MLSWRCLDLDWPTTWNDLNSRLATITRKKMGSQMEVQQQQRDITGLHTQKPETPCMASGTYFFRSIAANYKAKEKTTTQTRTWIRGFRPTEAMALVKTWKVESSDVISYLDGASNRSRDNQEHQFSLVDTRDALLFLFQQRVHPMGKEKHVQQPTHKGKPFSSSRKVFFVVVVVLVVICWLLLCFPCCAGPIFRSCI